MHELTVTAANVGDTLTATLSGAITELSSFVAIVDGVPVPADGAPARVIIDLAGVDHINSCGVREWINLLKMLETMKAQVELRRCSVPMVRQMTMIPSARGRAHLASVQLPYFCPSCDDDRIVLAELPRATPIDDGAECPVCHATMEFDDNPVAYQPLLGE